MIDSVLLDLQLPDSGRSETVPAFMPVVPPQTAVVVVSGVGDEELAALAIQYGVQDYVVKGHFDEFLLGRVIRYSVERHRLQRELREKQAQELAALKALVPFCAYCGRVRDRASNTWHTPEEYLERYAKVDATHGICRRCRHELAAQIVEEDDDLDDATRAGAAGLLRGK
jgi:response regulator RpfG family c-di-GMP phosphodiesterase